MVDRLTKCVRLICSKISFTAQDVADQFIDNIFCLFGLPQSITSDHDIKFTSNFWKALHKRLGTRLNLSTAFHPQTDSQTEVMNKVLQQLLRNVCSYNQDSWSKYLSLVEFAMNNAKSSLTKVSPFFADTGRHPRTPFGWPEKSNNPTAENLVDRKEKIVNLV